MGTGLPLESRPASKRCEGGDVTRPKSKGRTDVGHHPKEEALRYSHELPSQNFDIQVFIRTKYISVSSRCLLVVTCNYSSCRGVCSVLFFFFFLCVLFSFPRLGEEVNGRDDGVTVNGCTVCTRASEYRDGEDTYTVRWTGRRASGPDLRGDDMKNRTHRRQPLRGHDGHQGAGEKKTKGMPRARLSSYRR